jgi:hypothetical protein
MVERYLMVGASATVYHRDGQSWQKKDVLRLCLLNVCKVTNHEV